MRKGKWLVSLVVLAALLPVECMGGGLASADPGQGHVRVRSAGPHLRNDPSAGPADYIFQYGASTDRPVVGDWDGGDGISRDGIGIVRRAVDNQYEWHLRNTAGPGQANHVFIYGAYPSPWKIGNWDGLGGDGPGVVINNGINWEWRLRNDLSGGPPDYVFAWGSFGNEALAPVGNWDGAGGDGISLIRYSRDGTGQWIMTWLAQMRELTA